MRQSLFAIAVLATLGAASMTAPASAAPGMIGAVETSSDVVQVRRDGHHGMRGHGHGHHRGHHMGRGHHRGHHMMRHGHHHRHMGRHRY